MTVSSGRCYTSDTCQTRPKHIDPVGDRVCLGGEIGRRKGLKILRRTSSVPVRLRSRAPIVQRRWRIAAPPPCWADPARVKHPIVNKGELRMNANRHEYGWTCLAAMTSRKEAHRERGRPARTTLARPHPSLPPGSTGNGATIPLQPSPGRSCRQGGRVPHHGETERPPNAEDAGETPALPEGRLLPSFLLREEALPLPMWQCRPAW